MQNIPSSALRSVCQELEEYVASAERYYRELGESVLYATERTRLSPHEELVRHILREALQEQRDIFVAYAGSVLALKVLQECTSPSFPLQGLQLLCGPDNKLFDIAESVWWHVISVLGVTGIQQTGPVYAVIRRARDILQHAIAGVIEMPEERKWRQQENENSRSLWKQKWI